MDAIKDFLKPELIWFLIGLVLLILEFIMPGLIIGFFGIGAWIVAIICLLSVYVAGSRNPTSRSGLRRYASMVNMTFSPLLVFGCWFDSLFFFH